MFLALTEGDNRNVMAAQLAAEALGVAAGRRQDQRPGAGRRPTPSSAIATLCRTGLMVDAIDAYLGPPADRPRRACCRRPGTHPGGRRIISTAHRPTAGDPAATPAPAPAATVSGGLTVFVLVVGGGKVGYYLAKELIESGHEVALMEKDRARASRSPTRSARSSSPTTAARASTSARPAATGPTSSPR